MPFSLTCNLWDLCQNKMQINCSDVRQKRRNKDVQAKMCVHCGERWMMMRWSNLCSFSFFSIEKNFSFLLLFLYCNTWKEFEIVRRGERFYDPFFRLCCEGKHLRNFGQWSTTMSQFPPLNSFKPFFCWMKINILTKDVPFEWEARDNLSLDALWQLQFHETNRTWSFQVLTK
jgi:hypothetical protein